ncbi:hypothetical protein MSPP1_003294 [Malassezia sp. CBS 17886]|nr:hypothetical protein MSPP1_003294 [Malassezia sp. CBS 17886]
MGTPVDAVSDTPSAAAPSPGTATSGGPATDAMTPAERREHSRRFSQIHTRNLSAFFPHPDTDAAQEHFTAPGAAEKPHVAHSPVRRDPRHTRRASYVMTDASGHPSVTWRAPTHMRGPSDRPASQAWTTLPHSPSGSWTPPDARSRSASATGMRGTAEYALPVARIGAPFLALCAAHAALGSALWVFGLVRDSLALVGLGFLVVFDVLNLLTTGYTQRLEDVRRATGSAGMHAGAAPDGASSCAHPYSHVRMEALLDFSLIVYLMFAGLYMCKENAEHALLASSAPHEEDREGIVLPALPLALVFGMVVLTNVVLRSHARLAAACGLGLEAGTGLDGARASRHSRHTSVLAAPVLAAGPLYDAVSNPFSVMLLFFAAVLLGAALLVPATQFASFDKVLAGLEGASMLFISASAVSPLCRVLLQGSPSSTSAQWRQLVRAIGLIESHRAVVRVDKVYIWQLTMPTLAYTRSGGGADGRLGLAGVLAMKQAAKSAALVVTLHVVVQRDAPATVCHEVIQYAWQQCAPLIGASPDVPAGEPLRGALVAGELTVQRGLFPRTQHAHPCT